jgi:hypothetical protein
MQSPRESGITPPVRPSVHKFCSFTALLIIRAKEDRVVRFLLSPPPEETMELRSSSQRVREVLPTDPKEDDIKLKSAKHWGKEELRLLGVDYYMSRTIDLNKQVLGVSAKDWSSAIHKRIFPVVELYGPTW